jgi:hypothetical protein
MRLFGFGGNKSKTDKHIKKLTNAYAQTHERLRMMEILSETGSQESLLGLLQRFTFRTEASIIDEDEKEYCYKLLVSNGPVAIEPIRRFVAEQDAVFWPIKALREIAGIEAAVDLLLSALDRAEDREERVNEQKLQLVANLRDYPHPKIQARLNSLVEDPSEDVRIMAVDGLMTYGEETALEPSAKRVLDPEESPRVKMVILEQLIEHQWLLEPWRDGLEEDGILPFPYRIGANGMCERES